MWTRGYERRAIAFDDRDRRDLLVRLERVLPACGTRCFAWAFLSNHLHLVVQSGEVPIGRVLSRVLTGFALRFNRRHDRSGYLFESRFGSRRVASNSDLMNLIRYVHLNPVRAGLATVDDLGAYLWSGHGALIGTRAALPFEAIADTLALFAPETDLARQRLSDWMTRNSDDDTPDAPPTRRPAKDLEALIRTICAQTQISEGALLRGSHEAAVSRTRAVICYLAVGELGIEGRAVATALHITPGAVSQLVRRGDELLRLARNF